MKLLLPISCVLSVDAVSSHKTLCFLSSCTVSWFVLTFILFPQSHDGFHTYGGGFWNYFSMGKRFWYHFVKHLFLFELTRTFMIQSIWLTRTFLANMYCESYITNRRFFCHGGLAHLTNPSMPGCHDNDWPSNLAHSVIRYLWRHVAFKFILFVLIYVSFFFPGMDAQVSYAFHSERKLHPEKFRNQLVNQVFSRYLFIIHIYIYFVCAYLL